MTDNLLPFAPHRLARADDPETSHMAAVASQRLRGRDHQLILTVLRSMFGRLQPRAAEEIADQDELLTYHAVARRMAELERAGLVEKAESKHRNRSGRLAFRYRIARNSPTNRSDGSR